MGLSFEEQKKSQDLRFQLRGETNNESSNDVTTPRQIMNQENNITSRCQVEPIGCCQQTSDSCCQKMDTRDANTRAPKRKTFEKKKSNKIVVSHIGGSSKNASAANLTRKVRVMPTRFEGWEREDTYAALAVVCAAVSVVVAYSCYKQMS